MFIEVSSNSEKYLVNIREIVFIDKSDDGCVIHFAHIVGSNGKITMGVDQSYEELRDILVGSK